MRFAPPKELLKPAVTAWALLCLVATSLHADVKLPNVFGTHMVLQQGQKNKVWGLAEPGEAIVVTIDKQKQQTKAAADGAWSVFLDPLAVGGPHTLVVKGKNEIKFEDVLVGEVWVCSGQSNMGLQVVRANDPDLEQAAANYPDIRLLGFPNVGTQKPVWSHDSKQWMVCSPKTVGTFSAVGYFFGRQLHQTLGVPVGLINNAWGGSSCEAWISRERLAADAKYKPLLDNWDENQAKFEALSAKQNLSDEEKKERDALRGLLGGNKRPSNIYNGVLKSHLGYGVRGAIWYQGEANATRAFQYRELFPLMIKSWRDEWGQGDFPFYWVQLADFRAEKTEPGDSDWAELREAQTMAMAKLPHTGQAVIIDIGEGKDIHPTNKVDAGRRLARWALANEYKLDQIAYHSPQYKSMEKRGSTIVLTFDHVGKGWRVFDVKEPRGFAIAGADRKFVWANAEILSDGRIEVTSDKVADPVAVRYGWADNPIVNVYNIAGLPLTPFRTDDFPGVTVDKVK